MATDLYTEGQVDCVQSPAHGRARLPVRMVGLQSLTCCLACLVTCCLACLVTCCLACLVTCCLACRVMSFCLHGLHGRNCLPVKAGRAHVRIG